MGCCPFSNGQCPIHRRATTHPQTGKDQSMDGQGAISKWRSTRLEMAPTPFLKMVMEPSRACPGSTLTTYSYPSAKWATHYYGPVPRVGSTNPRGRRRNGYSPRPGPFLEHHRGPCQSISHNRKNGRKLVAGPFCKTGKRRPQMDMAFFYDGPREGGRPVPRFCPHPFYTPSIKS
jgi:hypothetical protein